MKTTWHNKFNIQAGPALMMAALLQACGGGGPTTPVPEVHAGTTVLSGTVIYDAPVGKAKVEIRDAEGHSWNTEADAIGQYRIDVPAGSKVVPPILVRASGIGNKWEVGNGVTLASIVPAGTYTPAMVPTSVDAAKGLAVPFQVYAVASAPGTIHVTPATTLVVDRLTGHRADGAMQNLGKSGATIAAALASEKITTAETAVKQTLGVIGLPPILIDDPTSSLLVPVDLTTTYQKLVTGDILAAASNLLSAVVDNQIDFGCSGEGYGIMPDDGMKRPSCLLGANLGQGWRLTPFIGLEAPRSLDIETRAQELAGVNAPGGGWKFQSDRYMPLVRRSRLQTKILPVLQQAPSVQQSTTAAEMLQALRALSSADWSRVSDTVCKVISASELSDLTYSYQELKLNMKPTIVVPADDAAEQLLISGSSIKSTAINRVIPIAFNDGSRASSCPVFAKQSSRLLELAAGYTSVGGRPSLSDMLTQFNSSLTTWLGYSPQQRMEDPAVMGILINPATMISIYFPASPFDALDPNSAFSKFFASESSCFVYGENSPQCSSAMFTPDQFRSSVVAWAATVPPDVAAGTSEEDAKSLLARMAGDIAQIAMDEYELHFDKYFGTDSGFAPVSFKVLEAQGYAIYRWQKTNPEYALSVAVADVSKVGYRVNGPNLELMGQFTVGRVDSTISPFTTENLLIDPVRIVPVNVDPEQLPALAMCETSDLACMGRLRRTRHLTPTELTYTPTGSTSLTFATSRFWQNYINSPLASAETLPFDRGYADTSTTLKVK